MSKWWIVVLIALCVAGCARPGEAREIVIMTHDSFDISEEVITEGVDILLAIDVSSSMKTEDFKPKNRLEAAKEVVAEFIATRPHDRLGMVVFAARAITKCPLTLDHDILLTLLDDVHIGSIEDGTAIGTALATSVNRLKDSPAESRIIILLTDGVNNRGEIDPLTAAELAKTFGIKTYTVGAGTEGYAPYPFEDPMYGTVYRDILVEIDEETLQKIADVTGGQYFRATDAESLAEVYKEIDAMEKWMERISSTGKSSTTPPSTMNLTTSLVALMNSPVRMRPSLSFIICP